MDVRLAVASRREVRRYSPEPLPADVFERILDAGRLAGSAQNRQPWTFVLPQTRERIERLAAAVYAGDNVRGAAAVVAIAVRGKGPVSFDAGRAAQNMLLQAWSDGVGGCPNGVADQDAAAAALGLEDGEERVAIVLSLGYPVTPRRPEARSAEEWSERANRRPLAGLVRRLS
jgi:nitroreductase